MHDQQCCCPGGHFLGGAGLAGGFGGGGGAGLGGGAFNDATSTLKLTASSVTRNHANGSPGIGGGIYNLGTFSFDAFTVIKDNHASTSGDDIGP